MAAGAGSGRTVSSTYAPVRFWLIFPSWLIIGFFLVIPVVLMLIYSFLTKEFREWAYISIFIRSILQALGATFFCLLIGFPTAFFIATRPGSTKAIWLFLVTIPYWVNLLIRTVSMKFLIRENGPLNPTGALLFLSAVHGAAHLCQRRAL